MDQQKFWENLIATCHQEWERERLIQLQTSPTSPIQLILETVCGERYYCFQRSQLNLKRITSSLPLSGNQKIGLEIAAGNSAIALLLGQPATGKTRIAYNLANAAIQQQKRVLILSQFPATLESYQDLPNFPYWVGRESSFNLQQQLNHLKINYTPPHLLPDRILDQLRIPQKLETWLPRIETSPSRETLSQQLETEFPHLTETRRDLLAKTLLTNTGLLREQLKLFQLYQNLSDEGRERLTQKMWRERNNPILSAIENCLQPQQQWLQETRFDLIIVEDSHHLHWKDLILIAGMGDKLVLLGEEIPQRQTGRQRKKVSFHRYPYSFHWLSHHLLPCYTHILSEQYRLHPQLATPIYNLISNRWIQNNYTYIDTLETSLPSHPHLSWWDIRDGNFSSPLLEYLSSLPPQHISDVGVITFSETTRDEIQTNIKDIYPQVRVKDITHWVGKESLMIVLCCDISPDTLSPEKINIGLTRGKTHLMILGDVSQWRETNTLLSKLLSHPNLETTRKVTL